MAADIKDHDGEAVEEDLEEDEVIEAMAVWQARHEGEYDRK